ncbi:MAG: tRNA (N6-isopentenyl adenosine(37)-C2)-methylthiotransferase MiaB [Deltaproteobacteria bacterium]|nr:tRNA (N6-isopentenyl adenosine(37)-C2)-methylthiotransferase MiaB [Deltaproteobacteria bacterium]
MKRLYIQTYGCQMNERDSERIAHVMKSMDYCLTDRIEEADLVFLNTCSVRDKAEQKVYSALGRWRELKQKREGVVVGVGGCVAQQEGSDLLRRVPHLDLVFGTQSIPELPRMVKEVESQKKRSVVIGFQRDASYMEDVEPRVEVNGPKAMVTIMQGCNKVCSFCIVPYVRGREISRSSESIIQEIRSLVRQGVTEVVLLGQNVNSYGKTSPGELTFPQLLDKINDIEALRRIRFMTSHPQDLSVQLVEAFAKLERLCEHLHLPVQSGADAVLERMRRNYRREEYLRKIARLRACRPDIALSTDIIVGFPGETEEEFEQTLEILQEVEYDEIFAFKYSPRPHTAAAKLYRDDVCDAVKKERLEQVLRLQNELSLRKNLQKLGAVEEVLVEGPSRHRKGQLMGRTRTNRIVNFLGEDSMIGRFVSVAVVGASPNSLIAEVLSEENVSEMIDSRGIA